jgi:hypothetical protein
MVTVKRWTETVLPRRARDGSKMRCGRFAAKGGLEQGFYFLIKINGKNSAEEVG